MIAIVYVIIRPRSFFIELCKTFFISSVVFLPNFSLFLPNIINKLVVSLIQLEIAQLTFYIVRISGVVLDFRFYSRESEEC